MNIKWHETCVSADGTHHLWGAAPFYNRRFLSVLKYHAPGLASVKNETGAFHINIDGEDLYPERYSRTFGFYQGKASVDGGDGGWFHITINGKPLYSQRYQWCGNFQENRCPVRNEYGEYFHIDEYGKALGNVLWKYAGDYRDGIAVVQDEKGRHFHVDKNGNKIHLNGFADLDIFHKGFARARDERGWHHIGKNGKPLYTRRFSNVEPFYNGQARVEGSDGSLLIIDELGETITMLKPSETDIVQKVSANIVGYWKTYTIYAAVSLKIFDALPGSLYSIATDIKISETSATRLLRALMEMELVSYNSENGVYSNLPEGDLLRTQEHFSLAPAAISFCERHVEPWLTLAESLKQQSSVFLQNRNGDWFQNLENNDENRIQYQKALTTYARNDYKRIAKKIPGGRHKKIIDAAGGSGTAIINLLFAYPDIQGVLLERPKVVYGFSVPEEIGNRMTVKAFDLFSNWCETGDAVILARVLHDWNDEFALNILKNARNALSDQGFLYVIEFLLSKDSPCGGLLDLNMLVTTNGMERSRESYETLLDEAGFILKYVESMSDVTSVLFAELKR